MAAPLGVVMLESSSEGIPAADTAPSPAGDLGEHAASPQAEPIATEAPKAGTEIPASDLEWQPESTMV